MKTFDNKYLTDNIKFIAGVDEAGRGPLAGPVVAAAVVFEPSIEINGVDDSKKIPEAKRETLYTEIIKSAVTIGVAIVPEKIIDKINILNASLLAMKQAVSRLKIKPDLILVDGNKSFASEQEIITIIGGDSKSFAIAAASIIAKVTRDNIMRSLSVKYPAYHFEKNKGYPTAQHREVIRSIGPSPIHRKTFLNKIILTD